MANAVCCIHAQLLQRYEAYEAVDVKQSTDDAPWVKHPMHGEELDAAACIQHLEYWRAVQGGQLLYAASCGPRAVVDSWIDLELAFKSMRESYEWVKTGEEYCRRYRCWLEKKASPNYESISEELLKVMQTMEASLKRRLAEYADKAAWEVLLWPSKDDAWDKDMREELGRKNGAYWYSMKAGLVLYKAYTDNRGRVHKLTDEQRKCNETLDARIEAWIDLRLKSLYKGQQLDWLCKGKVYLKDFRRGYLKPLEKHILDRITRVSEDT